MIWWKKTILRPLTLFRQVHGCGGGIMNKENIHSVWLNLAGHLCTEQTFGVGGISYGAHRMISKVLFEQISDDDWRKET